MELVGLSSTHLQYPSSYTINLPKHPLIFNSYHPYVKGCGVLYWNLYLNIWITFVMNVMVCVFFFLEIINSSFTRFSLYILLIYPKLLQQIKEKPTITFDSFDSEFNRKKIQIHCCLYNKRKNIIGLCCSTMKSFQNTIFYILHFYFAVYIKLQISSFILK